MLNKLKLKSEFSRNVLTLMTGTTIAQAIPIVISPILTRIYTPEDFGVFALYMSLVAFISIIITARYEMAIVLPKNDEDAINILALSFLIMIVIIILTTFIIIFFKDNILNLFNAQSVGNLLYLVPISLFLAGLNQIFNYWSNRKEYFKNISSAQIFQSIGIGITQPTFGYFAIYGGLIFGNMIGRAISSFVYVDKFLKNDKDLIFKIDKNIMIKNMKKHKDFPLVNSLHAFSDIIRTSGSIMLISSFFGSSILGFYTLSLRVLQVPVSIIGSALGQVLYQKFTAIHNNNEPLYPYVKKVIIGLFIVSLPLFTILYFIAPQLFAFLFGEKWRVAGEYSQILVPYLFMNFLVSPISSIPVILEKQKEIFYISLFGNILFLIAIVIFNRYDFLITLAIISISQFIFYSYVIYWYFINLKRFR